MDTRAAIVVQDLHKSFGQFPAVQGVEFCVDAGKIFSLLGPNGAGKSTIISMLSCLLQPTKGEAWIMGHSILHEPMAVKAAIGVVPQEIALYEDLSARENLEFWAKMYDLRGNHIRARVDEVLDIIGLADRQKGKVIKYSGGMKRRLNIGIALLHRPDVIIMDEPTVGIDPQSRRNILDTILEFNRQGMTVLYTTHYMEEAQELSDEIAIMDRGKVIARGTHQELVKIVGEMDRIDLRLQPGAGETGREQALLELWRALDGVQHVSIPAGSGDGAEGRDAGGEAVGTRDCRVSLLVGDSNLVLPRLFELAVDAGVRISSVEIQEPNLEAVFLHLTGRALRD